MAQLRRELEQLDARPGDVKGGEQSAAFLRSVLAHIPAICSAVSPEGRILYVNRPVSGISVECVIGRMVYDFLPEESHAVVRATLDRVLQTGEPDVYTAEGPGARGEALRYENWLGPILADGRVVALTLITRDVTKEWETQRQLRDQEARLRLALEASGLGMWRSDLASQEVQLDARLQ